jgi:hypothetical protein
MPAALIGNRSGGVALIARGVALQPAPSPMVTVIGGSGESEIAARPAAPRSQRGLYRGRRGCRHGGGRPPRRGRCGHRGGAGVFVGLLAAASDDIVELIPPAR